MTRLQFIHKSICSEIISLLAIWLPQSVQARLKASLLRLISPRLDTWEEMVSANQRPVFWSPDHSLTNQRPVSWRWYQISGSNHKLTRYQTSPISWYHDPPGDISHLLVSWSSWWQVTALHNVIYTGQHQAVLGTSIVLVRDAGKKIGILKHLNRW